MLWEAELQVYMCASNWSEEGKQERLFPVILYTNIQVYFPHQLIFHSHARYQLPHNHRSFEVHGLKRAKTRTPSVLL